MSTDDLIQAVNQEWTARYGGEAVSEIRALVMRVRKLAEDRDCMLVNWKASEAELRKMHNKKKPERPLRLEGGGDEKEGTV